MTAPVDVLAVMAALMSAAGDAVDTNDADNYMDLPDERHDVLEARYGSVPRSSMAAIALTRLSNARFDAAGARAAVAELIAAAGPVLTGDMTTVRGRLEMTRRLRVLRAALAAVGVQS